MPAEIDDVTLNQIREIIIKELADLQTRSQHTETDRKPVTLDQQSVGRLSRMDSLQVQAMSQATEQRRRTRFRALQAALLRLGDEEYGYCVSCGELISPKRLLVDPVAIRCIICA